MVDYLNFGKGRSVNFSQFNGMDSVSLNLNDEKQKKIANSLFAKYDVNKDAILDTTELKAMFTHLYNFAKDGELGGKEAKRFLKSLGIEGCNREDLLTFINTMMSDADNILSASTSNGSTTVSYKPDSEGVSRTRTYAGCGNRIVNQKMKEVKDGVETTFEYSSDGKSISKMTRVADGVTEINEYVPNGDGTILSKLTTVEGGKTTVKEYAPENSGKLKSQVITEGSTVTTYDVSTNPPRPSQKVLTKGAGVTETTNYTYNDNGGVVETVLDAEGGFVREITKDAEGNQIRLRESVNIEGSDGEVVEENGVRIVTFKNEDRVVEQQYAVDENNQPVDFQYTRQPGEVWYAIAQAKYGVTDHKVTMQIVAKLKELAGVAGNSKSMPETITLPASIDLKDGTSVELTNIGALVSMKHNVGGAPRIAPPASIENSALPQSIEPLPQEQRRITIPTFEVIPDNADKTVRQSDGRYFKYNSDGRVVDVYDDEAAMKAGNNSVYIIYDDGAISEYQLNSFDNNGNWIGCVKYDGDGEIKDRCINSAFDDKGFYSRQVYYGVDGSVVGVLDNYVRDERGRIVSYDVFNADGTWSHSYKERYDNAGNVETLYYDSQDKGQLTEVS